MTTTEIIIFSIIAGAYIVLTIIADEAADRDLFNDNDKVDKID